MTDHSFFRATVPAILFACAVAVIAAAWWWMGAAVPMPQSPLARGEKLYCVSYAPFRGTQSPLTPPIMIETAQIEEDLARLSQVTDCVRTYAIEFGLDRIAEVAKRHGMKVIQGIWLSGNAEKNKVEIDTAIRLAQQYPDVIRALIVGNEVLLRGEMTAQNLAATIRDVKSRANVPVTYADVWEFWLRYRDVYEAVDFVTIHILPYWEDFPISAKDSVSHIDEIRKKVAAAFPNKEILIGETGFPSAGRMRAGALPSPSNQAYVIQGTIALSKRDNFRINVIEAFDQPWKRQLEGTVGGHWGLFDAYNRTFKFTWGEAVSDHPAWRQQIAGGILMAALVFGAAIMGRFRTKEPMNSPVLRWIGVAVVGAIAGTFVPLAIEKIPLESLGIGGSVRSVILLVLAIACPLSVAAALTRQRTITAFANVLVWPMRSFECRLIPVIGLLLVGLTLVTLQIALGLVFDPRYKDFPYAPLSAAVGSLFILSLFSGASLVNASKAPRALAEHVAAGALGLSLIYVVFNESFLNWQSVWLCGLFAALAFTLSKARVARG
jgi:exo-beta-1,3-glucanase (GH17 family)